MRILLTNDDGLRAEGLIPLIRWCRKLGEVIPVVPKVEQSGKSHSIEIHEPFEVKKVQLAPDITAWAVDSTPADCVRFAVLGLKMDFDLLISGVNRGLNIGRDIMYSGTAGAVFEAGSMKIPAIALSTDPASYPCDDRHLDTVYDFFTKHDLMGKHSLYNVNIPKLPSVYGSPGRAAPTTPTILIPWATICILPGERVCTPRGTITRSTPMRLCMGTSPSPR